MFFVGRNFVSTGLRIQRLRESKELSQEKLAELARVSLRGIQNIEYGKTKSPGIETLASIARALGVLIEDIVDEEILTVMRAGAILRSEIIIDIVAALPTLNDSQLRGVLSVAQASSASLANKARPRTR